MIQSTTRSAVAADITDPAQARRAVEGATVVYHAAMPAYHRWVQEFPAMNQSVVEAVRAADARLVYVDNLYMYGPTGDVRTEETLQNATDKKGLLRKRLAAELLAAHDRDPSKGQPHAAFERVPPRFCLEAKII